MTSNTDKFRALFLAALMVVSVFGATAAFAGGAAAETVNGGTASTPSTPTNVSANDTDIVSGTDSVVTVGYNASGEIAAGNIALYLNDSEGTTLDSNSTLSVDNGTVDFTIDADTIEAGTTETLTVDLVDTSTSTVNATTDFDVTAFGGDTLLNSNGTYWQGQGLLFVADDGASSSGETYQIRSYDSDGYENQGGLETEFTLSDKGAKVIDTSGLAAGDYVIVNETGETVGYSESIEQPSASSASFEIAVQDLTTEFADDSVDNAGGSDTTDLEVSSNRGSFDLVVSAELDGDAVAASDLNDTFVNGGMAVADVDVNSDDDEVTITTGADDTVPMNFSGLDGGDYDFTFAVDDTSAEDTDNITVNDIGEGELSLTETTVETAQGDVATINIEFTEAASSGTLLIGNAEEDGYQANVSLTDDGDGEMTVYFNTYQAGQTGGIVWADQTDEDDVANLTNDNSDEENLTDILDTGNYELAVSTSSDTGDTLDEPDGVGTLYVQERSTDAINLWTASSSNAGDLEEIGDVSTAVDDGELTESETFANGDAVVIQITASGLEGMVEDNTAIEDGVATDGFYANLGAGDSQSGYNLTATQLAPGNNQDPNTLDFSEYGSDNMTVFYDEASDDFYVVLDTDDFEGNFAGDGDGDLADGDEFELNFELQDKRLLDYEDGLEGDDLEAEYDTLSTEFTVEDRTAEFDVEDVDGDDLVTVEAAEGQVISGTTNVAPGSEVRIRAQGAGDARFVKEQTELTVQDDGTFSAEFDFSDRAVDEEFEATLRGDASATADGLIVEAAPETTEPTTTEPTTTEPTTTEPTTTEPTTTEETTTEETTTTSQQTPGFGIAVAMLALIGAALIALRRKN